MDLPYMPGARRVSPAGFPCAPGRVENGVRKRFRLIALLTLAVFMVGGTAASAATIANHMDYPFGVRIPNNSGSNGSSPGIWTWNSKPPSRCPKPPASSLRRTWATIS